MSKINFDKHKFKTKFPMAEYSHFGEKIITEEGKVHLNAHQYAGSDPSLTYKYILSPIAQFCVDHLTPKWLA
jgi:hypothetical protein